MHFRAEYVQSILPVTNNTLMVVQKKLIPSLHADSKANQRVTSLPAAPTHQIFY